ncbi:hypothetical protein [Dyadobacter sp. CY343]|uniref:hypothetical protein n=1 Tax=Dyadobacter sp. CY343 TaxID=2907299 RepID=UPI001F284722|nr:hypothetical protein [Dyadobacter sp. CY343]MCE7061979.1 hypothetical protein [Dyadobacter sp. CY343]
MNAIRDMFKKTERIFYDVIYSSFIGRKQIVKQHIVTYIVFFVFGTIGCDFRQKRNAESVAEASISLPDTSMFAILPVTYERYTLGDAKQDTLNEKDLLVVEYALRKSVKLYNDRRGAEMIDLARYRRQYFPGIMASGDREVLIRCMHEDFIKNFHFTPYNWRKDNITIHDGGDQVFSLKVNFTTYKTYGFVINGSETL